MKYPDDMISWFSEKTAINLIPRQGGSSEMERDAGHGLSARHSLTDLISFDF